MVAVKARVMEAARWRASNRTYLNSGQRRGNHRSDSPARGLGDSQIVIVVPVRDLAGKDAADVVGAVGECEVLVGGWGEVDNFDPVTCSPICHNRSWLFT
jgi:hypothetical protein